MNMCSVSFRKQRHDATARILREAAEAVLADKGVDSVTMRDIAAKAGCAPGTIYLYFKTKQDVLDAIAAWHSDVMLGELHEILGLDAAPMEKLRRITAALVSYFSLHRSVTRILSAGGISTLEKLPEETRRKWEGFLAGELELIRAAQKAGDIRNDRPAELVQQFMYIVIIGLREDLMHREMAPEPETEQAIIWEFLSGGIGGEAGQKNVLQKAAKGAKK
jgi:AcrR family transcriptional regulator